MSAPAHSAIPNLEEKLKGVHVGVRADVDASRHLFRSEVSYIILDPVSFQSHALTLMEYDIFVRLRVERPLGEVFESMVADGLITEDRKQEFYEFVLKLHQNGLLSLPIVDDKALYQRFEQRRRRTQRALLFAFLSWKVPLYSPDQLLDRTVRYFAPLFTKWCFVLWLILIGAALGIVVRRFDELAAALPSLMQTENLAIMWLLLIGLKVVHEFGHAYACKTFGGKVPEMGAFFILMTPCAYMNANSSWEFSSKLHRTVVCLAGMYFESFLAAVATFVWVATEPESFWHNLAFQTMIIASITTIGFNINPLMRYDGYFIFSDVLEIPNLRSRSIDYLRNLAGRFLFGIPAQTREQSLGIRTILLSYGLAALLYRLLLMFTISLVLIVKFSLVGLILAGIYVGSQVLQATQMLVRFLRRKDQSWTTRARAMAVCGLTLIAIPVAIVWVPVEQATTVRGRIEPETYITITSPITGTLESIDIAPGDFVEPKAHAAQLTNTQVEMALIDARIELTQAQSRWRDAVEQESPELTTLTEELEFRRHEWAARSKDHARLTISTTKRGVVLDALREHHLGQLVKTGQPLAVIGVGQRIIALRITEQQLIASGLKPGDTLTYRSAADPGLSRQATILSIGETASRQRRPSIKYAVNNANAQDRFASGPEMQPHIPITLSMDNSDASLMIDGATALVRLPEQPESMARRVYRRALLFINRLQAPARDLQMASGTERSGLGR